MLEHEVDVAIAGRPPDDERIDGRAFLPNELVLIAAPDDPLAGARSVAPDELADHVWLQREVGSGTRELVEDFLADHDLRPQTLTLGSNGAIKEAVRLGLGVSLQSRMAVDHELADGTLSEISVRGGLPPAPVVHPPLGDRPVAACRPALPRLRARARGQARVQAA